MEIQVYPAEKKKEIPAEPVFGKFYTDHMFMMDYRDGKWENPRIEPFGNFSLSPAAMVLHYGQAIFEGMKAFYAGPAKFNLFRPEENIARFNRSAERMVMPSVDPGLFMEALIKLVSLDFEWIPKKQNGFSLYIRPFMIATEGHVGLRAAKEYTFAIILSPVGPYFGSLAPTKIYVSDSYSRACQGGVGEAKTSGNYAASLYAGKLAAEKGYSQVLWLDAKEHRFVEEVGAMNIFFVMKPTITMNKKILLTPPLSGTILPGVTRNSVLKLAMRLALKAVEIPLDINDIILSIKRGDITEVFGAGTAAVIAPVGELYYKGEPIVVNQNKIGPVTQKLFDELTGIQYGKIKDPYGWIKTIEA